MNKNYKFGPVMAKDSLGRELTSSENFTGIRNNRLVGMFYFLWCGEHGRHKPYDVSKILTANPREGYNPDSDIWGGIGTYHHWGEPFYGYYYSDDEWVIRKHMKLLIMADIDFLFFDSTNAIFYEHNSKLVMKVLDEYSREGWKIPKIIHYTNTDSANTAQTIYEKIYKAKYLPDTWFYYDGKPLIIAKKSECSKEVQEFFTIKEAQWPNEADKQNGWPWMDFTRPQRVFDDLNSNPEVINVSIAQHPQIRFGDSAMYGEKSNCGRGYHNGENDPNPDAYLQGYNFSEQFDRALETDPPVVLITGWNEWIMGRWESGNPERPILFVDCANWEYSRDIEMMRNGYFDNYYMQLISYIRKYKGTASYPIQSEKHSIDINGCFCQWDKVELEYYNFHDGAYKRNSQGYDTVYTNFTGRNEIDTIKVANDEKNIYFYIKTLEPITDYSSVGSWLKIYINTNKGVNYDFIVNDSPKSSTVTTLANCVDNDLDGQDVCQINYKYTNNQIMFEVPINIIGNFDSVWFKCADSRVKYKTIENFYENGDVAPIGRLNFIYKLV